MWPCLMINQSNGSALVIRIDTIMPEWTSVYGPVFNPDHKELPISVSRVSSFGLTAPNNLQNKLSRHACCNCSGDKNGSSRLPPRRLDRAGRLVLCSRSPVCLAPAGICDGALLAREQDYRAAA